MQRMLALALLAALVPLPAAAQPAGVLGNWQDPSGSIIRIGSCGGQVCLWLIELGPSAPSTADIHNPDPALRSRALCGLKIGAGFVLRDPAHAAGGSIYDPKSGKTYRGAMTAEDGKLDLRGYVGIPLFGESQTWVRPGKPVTPCGGAPPGD
jgi:uncharacterized protein (DUF2147 family)